MARWIGALLKHVHLVGTVSSVSLSTHMEEDAEEWISGHFEEQEIVEAIERRQDVASVTCICDLECTNVDGGTFNIGRALMAYIEYAARDQPDPTASLESTVILDTDVYAAVSWGDVRDNRELSRFNAPRFNRFLGALVGEISANTVDVDAPDYKDQLDAHGFAVPE